MEQSSMSQTNEPKVQADDSSGSLRTLLRTIWRQGKARWVLVGQVLGLIIVVSLVVMVVPPPPFPSWVVSSVWWTTLLLVNLLMGLLGIAVLRVVQEPPGQVSLARALWWALLHVGPLLVTLLLWWGLLLTGGVLLLVPALVVLGYTLFTFVVYCREGEWGVAALVRSTELVSGAWWSINWRVVSAVLLTALVLLLPLGMFGGVAALGGVQAAPGIVLLGAVGFVAVSMVFEAVMTVVWALLLTELYRERTAIVVPFSVGTRTRVTSLYRTAATIGWLLPLLAAVVGIGLVIQTPGLLDRTLLYLTTGI